MADVKKLPMSVKTPCSVKMSSNGMKVTRQFSGACPNLACLTVDGVPFCAAHMPKYAKELYP